MSDESQKDKFGFAMVPNNDPNYLMQKRNVDPIRKQLQESLSGVSYFEVKKDGEWKVVKQQLHKPRINNEGLHQVMMFFDMIVNNQTVMGYIKREDLGMILFDARINLLNTLWTNAPEYDLKMTDMHAIIGDVMACIRLFLTRPIDNKERESDTQSVKVSEIYGQGQRRKNSITGL